MDFFVSGLDFDFSRTPEKFENPLCQNGEFGLAEMGNSLCRFGESYFTINSPKHKIPYTGEGFPAQCGQYTYPSPFYRDLTARSL